MRRKEPVATQVFRHLYPRPEPSVDPTSWHHHVKNDLVSEIRHCTRNFYGEHESIEARYPGLDYNSPHIQRRLSRYSHHRRLFQTFKALGLTPFEIYELCNWEGTLFVQRRFEREHGRSVVDTTGNDIPAWVEPHRARARHSGAHVQLPQVRLAAAAPATDDEAEMHDADEENEDDDEAGELYDGEFEQDGSHDEATTRALDENKSDGEEDEEGSEQPQAGSASFNQSLTTMSTRQLDQMLLEQQRARQRTPVTMQPQLQNQPFARSQPQRAELQGFPTYQQTRPSPPASPHQLSRTFRTPVQILQQRRQQQLLQQQPHQQQHETYLPSSPLSRHTSVPTQPAASTAPPLNDEQIQAHLDYLRDNVRRISTPGSGFNIDETFRYLESRGVPWDLLMRTVNDALFQHTQEPSVRS